MKRIALVAAVLVLAACAKKDEAPAAAPAADSAAVAAPAVDSTKPADSTAAMPAADTTKKP